MCQVQILFSRSILAAMGAAIAGGLAFSSFQLPATADAERCNPIGRITQGSGSNFREGDIICLGQQVQSRETTRLLCFVNFKEVTLPSGTVVVDRRICGLEGSSVQTRDCAQAQQCFYPKGTEAAFDILQPQAGLLASTSDLTIAWEPVGGATSYRVSIAGPDLHWEQESQQSALSYPPSGPPLRPGNAYQIVVSAVAADGSLLGSAATVVNVAAVRTAALEFQSIQSQPPIRITPAQK